MIGRFRSRQRLTVERWRNGYSTTRDSNVAERRRLRVARIARQRNLLNAESCILRVPIATARWATFRLQDELSNQYQLRRLKYAFLLA